MTIYLASDHAGFKLKEAVKKFLVNKKHEVKDLGALKYEDDDDYPDYVKLAAEKISKKPEDKAIIFGKSGQGEAIAANRYKNVHAIVYYGEPAEALASGNERMAIIKLSREHNDANVLSLGAGFLNEEQAIAAIELWLATPFSGEERHTRRIQKIEK